MGHSCSINMVIMTQEQNQKTLNSESNRNYVGRKHKPIIGMQSMWSSWYDSADGLEGRSQFGQTNPCYRVGGKKSEYTEFADLDD